MSKTWQDIQWVIEEGEEENDIPSPFESNRIKKIERQILNRKSIEEEDE